MIQQTCNPDWLEAFLQNELSEIEEQQFTRHLDECAGCREELQSRAAEQAAWQEASSLLGGVIQQLAAVNGDHRTATVRSPQIEQILHQLAPTDDPASLGRIGGYEVTGVVGAGGMGVVLKAHDRSLDRIVAIKVMSPHLASSGSARKRFAREAKAAAAVLHPNVIAIHGVASDDACLYLVMPYVRGASLQKRIDSQGPLPLKDTLRIGAQIAAGLTAAHQQGLVHRDIKPANILLEEGVERVTITDFGLARAVDDASMTCSGVIAGTPQYMSPEQTRGEPIDARSDLFSLGSVLYAMCAGRSPFRAETTYGVLHRIANDNPTPICEVNSDVPVWLSHIIDRLMAKRPDDRFESAAQVAELLEGCLAHVQQPSAIPLPEEAAALAPKKTRRPPIGKFIAAAAGAFALFFAGILIVLELNKGTLTIECVADDVPIRIMQGDKLVEKLTISTAGKSVRVAVGNYKVEIDGDGSFDNVVVNRGRVDLKRGQTEVVRILHSTIEVRKDFSSLERIANLAEETEVHVVGCYSATNNQPVGVRVQRTGKPMVVVLNAYHATSWNLDIDKDADVRGVVLSGYFDQRFSHMAPKDQPTRILTYFPVWKGISDEEKTARANQCFYVWSPLLEDFGKMQSLIRSITDRNVTTFQGIYSAESFVINGQRGAGELQVATRWQNLSQRSDRGALTYRRTLAQLESLQIDHSGLSDEQIQRLNQLMDEYESELNRNGEKVDHAAVPGTLIHSATKNEEETPDFILLGLYGAQVNANRESIAKCAIKMPEGSTIHEVSVVDVDDVPLETPQYGPIPFGAYFAVRHNGRPSTFRVTNIPQHAGQSIFAEFQVADLSPMIAAELKGHGDFEIEVTDADIGKLANGKRVFKAFLLSPISGARIRVATLSDPRARLRVSGLAKETETVVAVLQLSDRLIDNLPAQPKKAETTENEVRAWQQANPYTPPNFNTFFPDSKDGTLALDELLNSADKDSRSDAEILKAVREGFGNTRQHRMPILRWIGNKYIWNKSPQNPDAIEIMYHAADSSGEDANPSGARHAAVYFGLSVTQPKTPAILQTLAELAMRVDDPNDLDRIAWGCSNQKAELLEYLKPFDASDDEAIRNKADVCRRIFTGELKAFAWAAEQARQRAQETYSSQLPQFKETLMSGSSEDRLKALQTILAQRIALIMDDSFVAAFAKCAEDKDPQVRVQTTIIAGAKWIWEAQEQNSEAIELMLKLSKDDHRDVRYNAVYYGLSTVRNKSDDVIRRLLEMAFEDREPNLFNRIEWGLRDDRERVATLLTEYINGDNAGHAKAAREVFKQLAAREIPQVPAADPVSDTPEDF